MVMSEMADELPTTNVPSPQCVGREFVRQYYTLLAEAPHYVHRFYSNESIFVRENEEEIVGQTKISQKIASIGFSGCRTRILALDAHETIAKGIVVQVIGEISVNGEPESMRRFVQTFVLAPQSEKKYYVHNDIFRYEEELFEKCEEKNENESTAVQDPMVDRPSIEQRPPRQVVTNGGTTIPSTNEMIDGGKSGYYVQSTQQQLAQQQQQQRPLVVTGFTPLVEATGGTPGTQSMPIQLTLPLNYGTQAPLPQRSTSSQISSRMEAPPPPVSVQQQQPPQHGSRESSTTTAVITPASGLQHYGTPSPADPPPPTVLTDLQQQQQAAFAQSHQPPPQQRLPPPSSQLAAAAPAAQSSSFPASASSLPSPQLPLPPPAAVVSTSSPPELVVVTSAAASPPDATTTNTSEQAATGGQPTALGNESPGMTTTTEDGQQQRDVSAAPPPTRSYANCLKKQLKPSEISQSAAAALPVSISPAPASTSPGQQHHAAAFAHQQQRPHAEPMGAVGGGQNFGNESYHPQQHHHQNNPQHWDSHSGPNQQQRYHRGQSGDFRPSPAPSGGGGRFDQYPPEQRVFLKSFPESANEKDLKDALTQHGGGGVADIKIIRRSGVPSYAFACLDTVDLTRRLLKMKDIQFHGGSIFVLPWREKGEFQMGGGGGGRGGGMMIGGGGGSGGRGGGGRGGGGGGRGGRTYTSSRGGPGGGGGGGGRGGGGNQQ